MELISELGLEGINAKARKSGRPSRWNSLPLGIMLIIALGFAVVVSGDTIPEYRLPLSGWKNVTFDDLYNYRPNSTRGWNKQLEKGLLSDSSGGFFAYFLSFFGILLLELGDKTFFVAAVLSMRHSRHTVFAGVMTALGLMTVMSTLFGYAALIIPNEATCFLSSFISTVLFGFVGSKMLNDGYRMPPDEGQEVQATLPRHDEDNNDIESQTPREAPPVVNEGYGRRCIVFSLIFLQAFTMTLLTEWGDRSQIATSLLAFREDVTGVCIGALLAHFCCIALAVEGGRKVAAKISKRLVTIIGGVVFYTLGLTSMTKGFEFKFMSLLQRLRKDTV